MPTRWTTAIITFHLFWFSGTLIAIILVLFSIRALSTTVLSSRLSCITDFALKIFTSLALSCNYAKAFDWVDHNKLWKILKKMGIPNLTCLLRNLYAGQEATIRTGHRTDWFQIGKGVHQDCILSPWLFNFYAEYIMRNVRLDEAQSGILFAGEISITSDMQITPPLWQKAKN